MNHSEPPSTPTNKLRQWMRKRPVITSLITVTSFIFITLPEWGSSVWALFSSEPFFPFLAKKMNTLGLDFSLYWITTPIAFVMLTAILYLLVKGRRDLPVVKGERHDIHLQKIAEYQRKGLRKYVVVEKCVVNSSPLPEGKLYIEFTFYVTNYSMFYVSIPAPVDAVIEGSIHFKGDLLSGVAKIVENKVKELGTCGTYYFTVRQWVSASEAADISETLKTTGNLFDFSKAIVNVRGGDRFPDVEMAQLDLTRGMRNAEFENKVIQLEALKSQYESEIELRQQRADAVEALSLVLGMAYSIDDLYGHGLKTGLCTWTRASMARSIGVLTMRR